MGQALGCIQVDQSTVAITESFGKFDDVLQPGCHCLPWCFGKQAAGVLSLRVQQLDVRCETKTKVCLIYRQVYYFELTIPYSYSTEITVCLLDIMLIVKGEKGMNN